MKSTTRLPGITGKPLGWVENFLTNWTERFGEQLLFRYPILRLSQAFAVVA
jgi:hypothetical protein